MEVSNTAPPASAPAPVPSAVPAQQRGRGWRHLLLVCAWLSALTLGYAGIGRFETAPGAPAQAPPTWPAGSGLVHDAARPTLLAFVHPRCPCTRATIAELERLLAVRSSEVRVQIVVVCPPGAPADFATSAIERIAAQLPTAAVRRDDDGVEAVRFGAATSGQVLVYAADGRLLFSGGITPARGQEGASLAAAALAEALEAGRRAEGQPVFGCPLFAKTDTTAERTCPRP